MSVLVLLIVAGRVRGCFPAAYTWHNGRGATGVSLAETRDQAGLPRSIQQMVTPESSSSFSLPTAIIVHK
jgi:hypothetical protein